MKNIRNSHSFSSSAALHALKRIALVLLLPLLLSACVSTPASRIAENQDYFDSLPVAAQARIRSGQIETGFTPDMVRLALGEPSRVFVRRQADTPAPIEVWLYTAIERRYDRQRIEFIDLDGPAHRRPASAMATIFQEREIPAARVEFLDGAVHAWELPAESLRQ